MVIVTYSLYSNIRSLNQLAAGFTQQNLNSKHREEDVNITAQIPQSQADYKPVSIYFFKGRFTYSGSGQSSLHDITQASSGISCWTKDDRQHCPHFFLCLGISSLKRQLQQMYRFLLYSNVLEVEKKSRHFKRLQHGGSQ